MTTAPQAVLPRTFQPFLMQTLLWWPVVGASLHYTAVPCGECGATSGVGCNLGFHPLTVSGSFSGVGTGKRQDLANLIAKNVGEGNASSAASAFLLLYHATAFALHARMGQLTATPFVELLPCPTCTVPAGAHCSSSSGVPHVPKPWNATHSYHQDRRTAATALQAALAIYVEQK